MKIKRLISKVLIMSLVSGLLMVPAFAEESSETYQANIMHSQGVNAYGTNFYDSGVSECFLEQLSITQNNNTLNIYGQIDGMPMEFTAVANGKNQAENILYFDVTSNNSSNLLVLNMMYCEDVVAESSIFKDNAERATQKLSIYIKDTTATTREYYFVEVYDFVFTNLDVTKNDVDFCGVQIWNADEFLPFEKGTDAVPTTYATNYADQFLITETYSDPTGARFREAMVIEFTHDCTDIDINQSETWTHTCRVVDKYRECLTDPDLGYEGGSLLEIDRLFLRVATPKNTAVRYTEIDGDVTRYGGVSFSASVGVALSALNVSAGLSATYTPTGTVDINETMTVHVNNDASGYARNIKVELDDGLALYNIDDSFSVINNVRDYGGVALTNQRAYCVWQWYSRNINRDTTDSGSDSTSFYINIG